MISLLQLYTSYEFDLVFDHNLRLKLSKAARLGICKDLKSNLDFLVKLKKLRFKYFSKYFFSR